MTVPSHTELVALGYDESGACHYKNSTTGLSIRLMPRFHTEKSLLKFVPYAKYWYWRFGRPETGKIDWMWAARELITECHEKGLYQKIKTEAPMTTRKAPTRLQNAGRIILKGRRINKRSRDELIMLVAYMREHELAAVKGLGEQIVRLDRESEAMVERHAEALAAKDASIRDALRDRNIAIRDRDGLHRYFDAVLRDSDMLPPMPAGYEPLCAMLYQATVDRDAAERQVELWQTSRARVATAWIALAVISGIAGFAWGCLAGAEWLTHLL